MTKTKLPTKQEPLPTMRCECLLYDDKTISNMCENCKVLLAHKRYAKEMLEVNEKAADSLTLTLKAHWEGYQLAIQMLQNQSPSAKELRRKEKSAETASGFGHPDTPLRRLLKSKSLRGGTK